MQGFQIHEGATLTNTKVANPEAVVILIIGGITNLADHKNVASR